MFVCSVRPFGVVHNTQSYHCQNVQGSHTEFDIDMNEGNTLERKPLAGPTIPLNLKDAVSSLCLSV